MTTNYRLPFKNWVQSPYWFLAFAVFCSVCIVLYLFNVLTSEVQPYTVWGLSYGIAAATLLLGGATYGIRRRVIKYTKKYGAGRTQNWLQFHIYGGTLFLLLVLMHSGFRVPHGALNWWQWLLSIWITVSGLLGVLLQKWIPKLLTSGLSIEVHYDRIPSLIREIKQKAETLIKNCDDPLRNFYHENLALSLVRPEPRLIYYVDITGGIQAQTKQFDYLSRFLSTEEKEKLAQLQMMYKTKLEIDAHYTLQRALRWWLFAHIPVSVVLIILVVIHVYTVLYY